MENINNKMDSTLMVTVPATLNLTDMVPQKEQAVDTSEERQKLSLLNVDPHRRERQSVFRVLPAIRRWELFAQDACLAGEPLFAGKLSVSDKKYPGSEIAEPGGEFPD